MNEQDFQAKLGELITQINNLPESDRGPLEQLAQETRDRHDRMKKTVAEIGRASCRERVYHPV